MCIAKLRLFFVDLPQLAPSLQQSIRIERHGLNADFHQPLREVEVIRWALAADADIFAFAVAGLDGHLEQGFHGIVAFVETVGDQAGVPIQTQRELREVVGADGEAVEVFEELFRQQGVGRDLAHHDETQAIHPALQSVLLQGGDDFALSDADPIQCLDHSD